MKIIELATLQGEKWIVQEHSPDRWTVRSVQSRAFAESISFWTDGIGELQDVLALLSDFATSRKKNGNQDKKQDAENTTCGS